MILYPGGRLSIARSRFTRSMDPASTLSLAPISFFGPSSCCSSSASSSDISGRPFFLRCISTTFTASRCSQVENADSPLNVAIFLYSCRNASCVRSSASSVLPVMRRHSEYTRRLCSPYRPSKDSASPLLARSIASASVSPDATIFFACVNLPLSGRFPLGCGNVAASLSSRRGFSPIFASVWVPFFGSARRPPPGGENSGKAPSLVRSVTFSPVARFSARFLALRPSAAPALLWYKPGSAVQYSYQFQYTRGFAQIPDGLLCLSPCE